MTPCAAETSPTLAWLTHVWFQGGWVGVDLFFVLSGFLVSGLLFREFEKNGALRVGHFLIRRGFKIYPPFWLLIGVTVVRNVLQHKDLSAGPITAELLFVQNYFPGLWTHTWSLAVEEHFYLLLAFDFFILARRRSARPFSVIPATFIAIALLCLTLRLAESIHAPFEHATHLFATHLRLDSLFFGVLLSYWFHLHPIRFLAVAQRFRYLLASCGVLLILPAFYFELISTPFIFTYGLTLFYLGSGCLLVAALGMRSPTSRLGKAVAYVGSHSYSIYLWHFAVATWGTVAMSRLFGSHYNWYLYAFLYLFGSIGLGIALANLIEIPILRLRDRLFPSRGTPLHAAGSTIA